MNIQIFGTSKCFDTKKAQRWFQERRIKFQYVDLAKYGMSGGEFDSVLRAVGGIDRLVNWEARSPDVELLRYLSDPRQKEDRVYENQRLIRTPVVRSGKQATAGYCPEVWSGWK
ncbi:MAG: ArsC family transcriptional regulator [Oscillospiraceae bacterium]|nr:ArsC family transcriptional regulator [Oscillospiraceae bacterium]